MSPFVHVASAGSRGRRHLSFSRGDAELLFQVFADRYERASLWITSNLAFSDRGQVFQEERMNLSLANQMIACHCAYQQAQGNGLVQDALESAGSLAPSDRNASNDASGSPDSVRQVIFPSFPPTQGE